MFLSSKIGQISSILGDDAIIVEGAKDKKVLHQFGVINLLEISGKSLIEIADILAEKNIGNVTILTDFDEDGENKKSQLTNYLSHYGIRINSFARKKFKSLFKIHKIEELAQFTKFMEDDYTGKTSSIYDKIFNRSRIHNRRCGRKTRHNWGNIRTD